MKRNDELRGRAYRRWRLDYLRANPLCAVCQVALAEDLDHIKPRSKGGKLMDLGNVQGLCFPCHQKKTASENERRLTHQERAWKAFVLTTL